MEGKPRRRQVHALKQRFEFLDSADCMALGLIVVQRIGKHPNWAVLQDSWKCREVPMFICLGVLEGVSGHLFLRPLSMNSLSLFIVLRMWSTDIGPAEQNGECSLIVWKAVTSPVSSGPSTEF